jgi:type IV pilus assembly protein PilC
MVTSDFFANYWYAVFLTPILIAIIVAFLRSVSYEFAYRFDALMLKMPIFGGVIRKINMARFTHFFGVMFNSGIDALEALKSGRQVVKNKVLQESIDLVHRSVSDGNRLTDSVQLTGQFPNLVVRMFKIGEESGNLTESLQNINYFYKREVNDSVERMVGMIQPTMTVIMGSIIFWVIAAVFGPLYDSFSKIKF